MMDFEEQQDDELKKRKTSDEESVISDEDKSPEELGDEEIEELRVQFPDDEIKKLEKQLREAQAQRNKIKKVNKQSEKLLKKRMSLQKDEANLSIKEKQLHQESKTIFGKAWEKIKDAFKYVFGKIKDAFKWVWEKIKDHPILTLLILLIAAGIYYYSGPLTVGYSAMAETAAEITTETARATLDVGPMISVGSVAISAAEAGEELPLFTY